MRVVLKVEGGSQAGKLLWLRTGQQTTVGRTERAEWPFGDDLQMSGLHFSVRCDSSSCVVRDLGSTNGTFVNGQRIRELLLSNGDQVVAGQTKFRIEIETPRAQPSQAESVSATVVAEPPAPVVAAIRPTAASSGAATAAAVPVPLPSDDRQRESARAWLQQRLATSVQYFISGVRDEDEGVRQEALKAAAWTRQRWLLEYCRWWADQASGAEPHVLEMLAVLGLPDDLPRILRVVRDGRFGAWRFRPAGAFGDPAVVPDLLAALSSADVPTAIAAAEAFRKITGAEITSDRRVPLPGVDPDMEPEEVNLPDAGLAQQFWHVHGRRFLSGVRWCRGVNLTPPVDETTLAPLDMESLWEFALRENYFERRPCRPCDLERFPQR